MRLTSIPGDLVVVSVGALVRCRVCGWCGWEMWGGLELSLWSSGASVLVLDICVRHVRVVT